MNQYRFEFLNDNNAPMAKCRYQIMQNDSILYQDIADGNGRAAFNSELVAGKKIRVRFWAEGQRQDAAFSTEPFYWTENVITQPIKAPKVYEVKLRETQNKNNEPANYRQAFYEVQAGDTWEGIAKKCNTNASSIKFLNNLPDDSTLPEVGDALLLPQGAERPLDSGSPSDKGVIESHSNEPQNDSLKELDEKTPGPEQDKPSILPQEAVPSVAENQPEHPSTIVENKKPEAEKKKDPIGNLLKELDEEKSKQKKDDQPILPQSAEPVGQGQPEQPAGKNPLPDEGKPAERNRFEPAEKKPDIQKGRGRNGRPTDRVYDSPKVRCFCHEKGMVSNSCSGYGTKITEAHYEKLAADLNVEKEVLKAVAMVESKGKGFINDKTGRRRAKILLERHKMYKHLKRKISQERLSSLVQKHPRIIYSEAGGYGSEQEQFRKLEIAKSIDEAVAIKSCSWGEFQVLGEYFNDGGYSTPQELEIAMNQCSLQQFLYFQKFLKITKPQVVKNMRVKNWKKIAFYYNGSGYRINAYDVKMECEYERLKGQRNSCK